MSQTPGRATTRRTVAGGQHIVALIDENIVTRQLLQLKLTSCGHQVTAFESDRDFLGTCDAGVSDWDAIVVSLKLNLNEPAGVV